MAQRGPLNSVLESPFFGCFRCFKNNLEILWRIIKKVLPLHHQTTTNMKTLNAVISAIEVLEAKRANGTITMDEETYLINLVELAKSLLK